MAYIVQVPMWVPLQPGSAPPQHFQQPLNMLPPYSYPQVQASAPPSQHPAPPSILSPIAEATSKLPPQLNASRLPFPPSEQTASDPAQSGQLNNTPPLDILRPQQFSPTIVAPQPSQANLPPPHLLAQQRTPLQDVQAAHRPSLSPMNPMLHNIGQTLGQPICQPMGQPLGQPAGQAISQLPHPHPVLPQNAQYQMLDPQMQQRRGSYMGIIPINGIPMLFDQTQLQQQSVSSNTAVDQQIRPPQPPQYFYAPRQPAFAVEGGLDSRAYRGSVSSNGSVPDLDSSASSASSNESSSPGNSPDLPSKKPYVTSNGGASVRLAPLRQNSDAQPLPQLAEPQIESLQQKRNSDNEPSTSYTKLPGRPAGSGRIGKQPVRDPIKLKHRVWLQQNRIYQDKLHNAGFRVLEGTNGTKKCSLCQKHFAKEMFVWRHALSHVDEKPFHCTVCDQKFTRSDTLQRHVRRAGHLGATCK